MAAVQTGPKRYKVVAAYVTCKTAMPMGMIPGAKGGYVVVGLYRDALLPPDVAPEDVERLLRRGYIEPVEVT